MREILFLSLGSSARPFFVGRQNKREEVVGQFKNCAPMVLDKSIWDDGRCRALFELLSSGSVNRYQEWLIQDYRMCAQRMDATHLAIVVQAHAAQRVVEAILGVLPKTAVVLFTARPADLSIGILRIRWPD